MSLVLYSLKRNYPSSIKGLDNWSAAMVLIFVGAVMATGLGKFPSIISISFARVLLAAGLYLTYVGCQRFFGVTPHHKPWIALIAFIALLQLWFTYVDPNFHVRLVSANLLAGLIFIMQTRLLLQQKPLTFAKLWTISVMVLMILNLATRVVTSFIWPIGNDLFSQSPYQPFFVATFVFCIFLLSIGVMLMATDRLRTELEHLATHDSLTNALTRRHMNEACERELERCRRHGHSMAFLAMDLDHFKAVNDTYGHQAGDRILINFVAKICALLRQPDHLGRFGGEEFVALLPETSLDEAILVAERILKICVLRENEPSCTVSIGITTNQKDTDTVDTLMKRADAALYRAKANGRNRVETA